MHAFKLPETKCFVMANAGTNYSHEEPRKRFYRAVQYVLAAHEAGADAVIFQLFEKPIVEDMFCWLAGDESELPRWNNCSLRRAQWQIVKTLSDQIGIKFIPSVLQTSTVDLIKELGCCAVKVDSRAARLFPYHKFDPRITFLIETGMRMPDGLPANAILMERENKYPTNYRWMNVNPGFVSNAVPTFLDCPALDAVKSGCRLLEMHFTIRAEHASWTRDFSWLTTPLEHLINEIRKCS